MFTYRSGYIEMEYFLGFKSVCLSYVINAIRLWSTDHCIQVTQPLDILLKSIYTISKCYIPQTPDARVYLGTYA